MSESHVIRIKPYSYIHVLDNNTNVTRVEVGPQTFTRQDHEKVLLGPELMITVPPRHYCLIANPIMFDDEGLPIKDKFGQVRHRHGDHEVRFEQDPFPLYPGEKLVGDVQALRVVPKNCALRLRAIRDYTKPDGEKVVAGDEWLFEGPGTYLPAVEVKFIEEIKARVIKPNEALKVRANQATIDRHGNERKAGEEWLVRDDGAYLPGVHEVIVEKVEAYILTERTALHIRALRTYTDFLGRNRKAGEEWLVTLKDCESYINDVYEEIVEEAELIALSSRQYCTIVDPVDPNTGKNQFGRKQLRKGECNFFLQPGESLEGGIQDIIVLTDQEALLLTTEEDLTEADGTARTSGDRWMIYGPCDYVPPVNVRVIEKRTAIPLDETEGVYVRDLKTGQVRAVTNQSLLLAPNEVLWEKDLPRAVEDLLARDLDPMADRGNWGDDKGSSGRGPRDKTRVVTFRAPHNSAVQVYDYTKKVARVVFGPDLVQLGPDEQFTVLSLSGDKPKRPNAIKAIALLLGPDFMTDVVTVETSDHARLQLKLSYNWHFDVDKSSPGDAARIFQVPDFVGDACKAIASRVRGAVAAVAFDDFHKKSAYIIRSAVFGLDDNNKVRAQFVLPNNQLTVTNIDIQAVEPVDQKTRDSLQKSVQMAIEITTKSQEAAARHEAERVEQKARGALERQKIEDEAANEQARKGLLQLQADSAAVESTGQATAEARARAEASKIEGESAVAIAQLRSNAQCIEQEAELNQQIARQNAELEYATKTNELEITKTRELAEIEAAKFKNLVDAIGSDTIKAIAQAGPEMQAKLLQGLGLNGYLITDGKSPINLFQTAQGMIAGGAGGMLGDGAQ
eukprot:TRINITY_DN868_c0_g3_i1.p1 TRINITY_DN868_c0_g3~~TRINITY_DN868_c0_g3_i1.p1  ORF type:complete len:849 (-),score=328.79 TRINITY_DN868_c0_g3_i1:60-2606(-)